MPAALTLKAIHARPVLAPLSRPLRTAVGAIPAAPLVLIDLLTEQGVAGRAYLFAYTPPVAGPLAQILVSLGEELKGRALVPLNLYRHLDKRFRLLGTQGLVGMAIGGLDMAVWDALARAEEAPLVALLGGAARPLPAYDSYGMVDPKEDAAALRGSVESGFTAIKIKLGGAPLSRDIEIVAGVREIIGPATALMVDYNQSLGPAEARQRIAAIAPYDIAWVEEPVANEDLQGHARVRAGSPAPIQTGENWWFPRGMAEAVAAGASDLAMLDVMKIGGVTGWLAAAAQAEAAGLPVSSHLFVEASAHLLPVTATAHWLEWLDCASAILREPLRPERGLVTARGPGLGLDWDEVAVKRYAM